LTGEGEGGGESRDHPPPRYPLPRGEGIFLKSEKKILRLKGVRIQIHNFQSSNKMFGSLKAGLGIWILEFIPFLKEVGLLGMRTTNVNRMG
jgi:hypothetical protein